MVQSHTLLEDYMGETLFRNMITKFKGPIKGENDGVIIPLFIADKNYYAPTFWTCKSKTKSRGWVVCC